jgi:hypothetical protein
MAGGASRLALLVLLTGLLQPVWPQSVAGNDRPNPSGLLLPPVAAPGAQIPRRHDASRDRPPQDEEPDDDRRPPPAVPPLEPNRRSTAVSPRNHSPLPDSEAELIPLAPIAPVRDRTRPDDEPESEPRPRLQTPRPRRYEPRPPAARLAQPREIQPVSAEVIAEAQTAAKDADRRPPVDLIGYLKERPVATEPIPPRETEKFGGKLFGPGGVLNVDDGRGWFSSDYSFPTYISPITNPFYFEDPRSLTELRPIFIYQKVPGGEPVFKGGDLYWIGTQARVAFTNRLSLVFHKIGGLGVNPSNDFSGFFGGSEFGFSEFWFGPKLTLIRDTEFGTLLAAGATFQLPIGSNNVYQNTGDLSIVPYLSLAQNFWSSRFGSFNGLIGTGYAASVNRKRSDSYYLSAHLDYDVGNFHRFYPVAELNWQLQTTNGTSSPLNFEGRDLINFGSAVRGANLLTGALGARFKVFAYSEIGAAFEIPLVGNRDLFDYRFTVDFILRY